MSGQEQRRFRSDLHITDISDETEGASRFVIRDPASGAMYELGEEEVFLCRLLDGVRDCDEIRAAFQARFGMSMSEDALREFYAQMDDYGLLEPVPEEGLEHPAVTGQQAEAMEEEAGVYLPTEPLIAEQAAVDDEDAIPPGRRDPYRWRLFNPDTLFRGLARSLRPARHLLWLLIPGVPAAFLSLFHHQPEYLRELAAFISPASLWPSLFMVVVGLFVINLLSKWMQGTVAAWYGVKVEHFGFRLAFGVIPRFYINKRPIWDMPRREKLWTFATPLLTKLALFVLGTLIWQWNSKSGIQLGSYALVVGHIGLGAFLFTVNPLWKADGYAWFITYFDLPRLRERAFQVLGIVLRGRRLPQALSEHERYGLIAYGLATIGYLLFIVGSALVFIAVTLETRYQGTGVVLFLAVISLFLHWTLRYLLRRSGKSRVGGEVKGQGAVAKAGAGRLKTVRKGGSFWKWLLALAVLGGVSVLPYPYEISGELTLYPSTQADVRARASGEVMEVLVREGEWVDHNYLVARLDDWEQRHAITQTQTELEKKRSELALLLAGQKPEEVAYVREQLNMAKVKASHSRKQVNLLAPGYKDGSVSALEYEKALTDADVDTAAVVVAQANLDLARSAPLNEQVAIKQAELKQLEEQLAYQEGELARTRLLAPQAGRVITVRPEQKIGNFLREGDLFIDLEDDRVLQAEIQIPETDIADVRLGAKVEVKLWSQATQSYYGTVTAIAPVVEDVPDNPFLRIVRVTSELPNPNGALKSQMTGYAKVDGGTKPVIVAFTRMLVRFFTIEVWSWVP